MVGRVDLNKQMRYQCCDSWWQRRATGGSGVGVAGRGHAYMSSATLTHRQLYTEAQAAAQAATSWLGSTTAIYDLET